MQKNKRIIPIIVAAMMIATMAMPASATEVSGKIDYTKHSSAVLDPNNSSSYVILADYVVSSDAWWIMSRGVGVGAEGWTDLDNKSDGSDKYHYSNIRVWLGSQYWESGRKWGYGKVQVSTGNVGQGALSSYDLYYGT